jgi:hypothetical protein
MGWRLGENKAQGHLQGPVLAWARAALAGDAAVDDRYAGPSCGRAAVDHRHYPRGMEEGLAHAPHHAEIEALLARWKTA